MSCRFGKVTVGGWTMVGYVKVRFVRDKQGGSPIEVDVGVFPACMNEQTVLMFLLAGPPSLNLQITLAVRPS